MQGLKFLFVVFLCFNNLLSQAQSFNFILDQVATIKIGAYNNLKSSSKNMQVYNIQFGVISDRRAMDQELANFAAAFDLKPTFSQNGPYYYLKCGNYLSKLEGYYDYRRIVEKYPGAVFMVATISKNKFFKLD